MFRGRRGRGAAPPAPGPHPAPVSCRSLPPSFHSLLRHGGQRRQPAGRASGAGPARRGADPVAGGGRCQEGAEPGVSRAGAAGGAGARGARTRRAQRAGSSAVRAAGTAAKRGGNTRLGLGVAELAGSALMAPDRETLGRGSREGEGVPGGTSPAGSGSGAWCPPGKRCCLLWSGRVVLP